MDVLVYLVETIAPLTASIFGTLAFIAIALMAIISFHRGRILKKQWTDALEKGIGLPNAKLEDLLQPWSSRVYSRALLYLYIGLILSSISLLILMQVLCMRIGDSVEMTPVLSVISFGIRDAISIFIFWFGFRFSMIQSFGIKAELKELKKKFPEAVIDYQKLKANWDRDRILIIPKDGCDDKIDE